MTGVRHSLYDQTVEVLRNGLLYTSLEQIEPREVERREESMCARVWAS